MLRFVVARDAPFRVVALAAVERPFEVGARFALARPFVAAARFALARPFVAAARFALAVVRPFVVAARFAPAVGRRVVVAARFAVVDFVLIRLGAATVDFVARLGVAARTTAVVPRLDADFAFVRLAAALRVLGCAFAAAPFVVRAPRRAAASSRRTSAIAALSAQVMSGFAPLAARFEAIHPPVHSSLGLMSRKRLITPPCASSASASRVPRLSVSSRGLRCGACCSR